MSMSNAMAPTSKCRRLFDLFKEKFPSMGDKIKFYGPMDRCAVKLETYDRKIYIFTFIDDNDWGLQTYKNYIDTFKEKR